MSRIISDLGVRVQWRAYRKMPTMRRLVKSSTTSRDCMTSQSWCHNLQSRRIRKLGPESTIRVDPLNLSMHYRRTEFKKSGHSAKNSGRRSIWRDRKAHSHRNSAILRRQHATTIQGGPKKVSHKVLSISWILYTDRFSKFFHCCIL